MSTRSNIRALCNDGKVRSIYVHFDGMSHLETLREHYNSQEQAELLMSLGHLSSLQERASPKMDQNHSFNNPVGGVCVAYGRDRGEKDTDADEYDTFEDAWADNASDIEYVYEWDKLNWAKYDLRRKERIPVGG